MLATVILVAGTAACGGATPEKEDASMAVPESITVRSSAFGEGQRIPAEYTCDGVGHAPPLTWSGTPGSAAAQAVVVDDPDAPRGAFTHWVVLDLPADTRELAGGDLPGGARQAANSAGREGYYPPCPPSGSHRYRFTVYALARPTGLRSGSDLDAALRAIRAAAVAEGRLTGLYGRGG